MKSLKTWMPVCFILLSLVGSAQASGYFAIEGSALTLGGSEAEEITPGGMRLRLGTQISELMDVEGHFGFSFNDSSDVYDDLSATFFGIYLKGYLPIGYNSALFVLGGMTNVNLKQKENAGEFKDSRGGFSYGVGLETKLTENADLTADYMSYVRDEGLFEEVSSFNFGLKLYF